MAQPLWLAYASPLIDCDRLSAAPRALDMTNSIAVRQNYAANLQRLAAQRRIYSRAKTLSFVQASLAALTPVIAAILVAVEPSHRLWAVFLGVVVPWFDVILLDPWQKRLRERGALVQEAFDCDVLDLPWNHELAGRAVDHEDIHEAATTFKASPRAPLEDWYSPILANLPLFQARIICQRQNCWWDAKLRRQYSRWILGGCTLVVLFVLVVGLANNLTLDGFTIAIVAPISPALLWSAREYQRQRETAAASDRLKESSTSLWERVTRGDIDDEEATVLARRLQDAIFTRRKSSPFVFDWIYERLRDQHENQMHAGATEMIKQLRATR
jgi:hypothetical protein